MSDLRFTINVTDANDQVPIFKKFDLSSGIFYASVYENQPVNTTVIKIIVEDKDPTENYHKVSTRIGRHEPKTLFDSVRSWLKAQVLEDPHLLDMLCKLRGWHARMKLDTGNKKLTGNAPVT